MNSSTVEGIIRVDEAYSKKTILNRLGISQKYWDKMLDEGLPYTKVGHSRWVTGKDLIEHFRRKSERKTECTNNLQKKGNSHAEATRDWQRPTLPRETA